MEGNINVITDLNILSNLAKCARDSIYYWCNRAQNKRQKVFKHGGDANFYDNNYIAPDLVSLKCDEMASREGNEGRWIEDGEHFDCNGIIERITKSITTAKLPINYLIEVLSPNVKICF
jgi:hypothetical protein